MSGIKGGPCHQKIQCQDPCKIPCQDPCQKVPVCVDPCQDPCKAGLQHHGSHSHHHGHHGHHHGHQGNHHGHQGHHHKQDPCNPCCPDPCQDQGSSCCNK